MSSQTMARTAPTEDRVGRVLKWVLLLVAIATFATLGWTTWLTYRSAPPQPDRFVAADGSVVMTSEDIVAGKAGFQRADLMDYGSIYGMGSYFGPDYTAQNLVRLAVLTGNDVWRERADYVIEGVLGVAGDNLFGHIALLNAIDLRLRMAEIVVTGEGAAADALAAAAVRMPFVDRTVLRAPTPDGLAPGHPARDKIAAAPGGAAFVCVGERCSLPVTQPAAIGEAVTEMRGNSSN